MPQSTFLLLSSDLKCSSNIPYAVGRILVQRCPHPNYQNIWVCYVTRQGEIKFANQLTFRWDDHLRLSGWAQHYHRILISERGKEAGESKFERFGNATLPAFNIDHGTMIKGMRVVSFCRKRQGNAFFHWASRRSTTWLTSWLLASEIHFGLLTSGIRRTIFYPFKPLCLW